MKWNGKAMFREEMKLNPDLLQTLRNLVYGSIEKLSKEEMREFNITEDEKKELPEDVLPVDPDLET